MASRLFTSASRAVSRAPGEVCSPGLQAAERPWRHSCSPWRWGGARAGEVLLLLRDSASHKPPYAPSLCRSVIPSRRARVPQPRQPPLAPRTALGLPLGCRRSAAGCRPPPGRPPGRVRVSQNQAAVAGAATALSAHAADVAARDLPLDWSVPFPSLFPFPRLWGAHHRCGPARHAAPALGSRKFPPRHNETLAGTGHCWCR